MAQLRRHPASLRRPGPRGRGWTRGRAGRAECACARGGPGGGGESTRAGVQLKAAPSASRRPVHAVRRRRGLPLSVGAACGLVALWQRQRRLVVSCTMSGFSSEERAAPFTLEYRVFLSECRRSAAPPRPPVHSFPGLASRPAWAPAARARPRVLGAGWAPPEGPRGLGPPGHPISRVRPAGGTAWVGVCLSQAKLDPNLGQASLQVSGSGSV